MATVMKDLRYMLQSYISIRRTKRTVLILAGFVFVLLLWWWISVTETVTSAIACKTKLAELVLPSKKERDIYLANMAHDAHTLEAEFFKVGHDFRFEKAAEKEFGCEVHAFDPSMGVETHRYSERGYFYNMGIDSMDTTAADGRWKMRRLSSIMKLLKHENRVIDYLKMDVEFSEWLALYDIIKTGLVHKIRQIGMETHTPEVDIHDKRDDVCTWGSVQTYQFMLKVLVDLRNNGFQLFYSRPNYRTSFVSPLTGLEHYCCHNLHFVNSRYAFKKWKENNPHPR